MSNPVTPGQPGDSPFDASGPYGHTPPHGQFGPGGPPGQQFGGAPQGQFGAPLQGQFGPAGAQGAYGPPPGPGAPVDPRGLAEGGYPPAPEPRRRRRWPLIVSLLAVLVVAIVAIVGWLGTRGNPANAKVGDCLQGSDINSTSPQNTSGIKIVSCTGATAKYKVVGKVDNKSETQFKTDQNICQPYSTATRALWGQTSGENGFVLCLTDVGK